VFIDTIVNNELGKEGDGHDLIPGRPAVPHLLGEAEEDDEKLRVGIPIERTEILVSIPPHKFV
jgi:hypothetical protein